jgi:hypothetical protein
MLETVLCKGLNKKKKRAVGMEKNAWYEMEGAPIYILNAHDG